MGARTQHRPRRDTSNQESAELKRENTKLKRQIARLRKQIEKEQAEAVEDPTPIQPEEPELSCPECESVDIYVFQTPNGKKLTACKACKYRFA